MQIVTGKESSIGLMARDNFQLHSILQQKQSFRYPFKYETWVIGLLTIKLKILIKMMGPFHLILVSKTTRFQVKFSNGSKSKWILMTCLCFLFKLFIRGFVCDSVRIYQKIVLTLLSICNGRKQLKENSGVCATLRGNHQEF